ncbi:Chromatin structure-remodeling complex subunit RSC1 [Tolypocladium paradoxum]|uniref:Chromatin structure-remodeling complex subunit RSC1 n=1 Tax=Tolypocladium paradoxum TaxID=94208 RepID=A0A2S4KZ46_9HYPO|nr:Chromatin structure-remodeling complex subunit RSC1 [Tolypocladium paradoxum]
MSARRASAPERRKSIEDEQGDDDVEMKDGADDGSSDAEREGSQEEEGANEDDGDHDMFQIIHKLSTYLCNVEEDGEELAAGFQRIPNRRVLPDYFEVISEPVAFSTIRGKTQKKQYTSFSEFVKDVAQICHNAQVYNRPSAPIFGAALRLREIFQDELKKLLDKGEISADDAKLPDLGELPPAEESPSRGSEAGDAEDEEDEEEEEEEEEEDDDEEEEEESSDDDGGRRRRRRHNRRRPSLSGRKDRDEDKDDDAHKKRGRPPMVLTPMEARISSILRGLRKFKDEDGSLLVLPFEKLPDKSTVPDYYQTISNPIALDNIKKKAKRKKYQNVDQVLADIELMFENAKLYNEDDSDVYQAAVELQRQARTLAEQEKAKPDDDFRDEDGKLPLAEIQYNGQTWRVGDWVHIRNPNDLAKPIVAQIFRTWQDRAGQRWINACWYYRPEQTVHRYEKHFFEHEVVKTGQYRDHQIGDVLDRCFVMFVTRFNKGRPRGFPPDKEVYVCESRYNEEKFRFNKIKTWASCVPDEVRERDYEMDLFDVPRRMRKVPSPIKHLLREDAKETDNLPRPTWGSPNAPPIVGAVHRRPPEPNESPPPEPTPPPQPPAPTMPEVQSEALRRSSMLSAAARDMPAAAQAPFHGPGPSPTPGQYHAQMTTPHFPPATPAPGGAPMHHHQTPVPIPHQPHQVAVPPPQMAMRPMHYQHSHPHQPQPQQPGYAQNYTPAYPQSPATAALHHQPMANPLAASYSQAPLAPAARTPFAPAAGNAAPHANVYNPPRPPEVYTLPDNVNEALPPPLRQGFQHDGAGRVLFFTAPPLDRSHKGLSPGSAALGHSVKYLAGRGAWLAERDRKRKDRDEARKHGAFHKRVALDADCSAELADAVIRHAADAVDRWFQRLDQETQGWQRDAGLDGWRKSARESVG